MKNELKKIMKKLDREFPGVTDQSIKYLIKQKEEKRIKQRNFVVFRLPSILIMLIFPPFLFFLFSLLYFHFQIQPEIVQNISIGIICVCIPSIPAILLWN